jgi:cold-inducible RNA-binding protein
MGKNLYVGGLSYESTEAEIKELFSSVGTVEKVALIIDRETGNSKGFAFVDMGTEEEAMQAIQTYNGYEFAGRKLVVNEARPKEDRKPSGGGYGGGQNRGGEGRGGYAGSGGQSRGGGNRY